LVITYRNYEEWAKAEGGIEHPTHLSTLQKPEQVKRIQWLKDHCDSKDILEAGCNWGYILNALDGKTGLDLNIENIDKAMREFPTRHWVQGDVTNKWEFFDNHYDIVILAEILEHIDQYKIDFVMFEALRVARKKILITIPVKPEADCACCFKHKWIPNRLSVGIMVSWLMWRPTKINIECDGNFAYIEVIKC
jgi:cyclopropane fatty-acyl-phospholipid synthase-like methyltransferase